MGNAREIRDIETLMHQSWYPDMLEDLKDPEKSYASIARKYGMTQGLMSRFVRTRLKESFARELLTQGKQLADVFAERIERLNGLCDKIIDACDEWLTDPDCPDRYTMDPRADEATVIYFDPATKSTHSASLQFLLNRLREEGGIIPQMVRFSTMDTRKIMLEALHAAKENAEALADISGAARDISVSIDFQGVILPQITNLFFDATVDAPIVRERFQNGLEKVVMGMRIGRDVDSLPADMHSPFAREVLE